LDRQAGTDDECLYLQLILKDSVGVTQAIEDFKLHISSAPEFCALLIKPEL